jgi:hypothetical protein
MNTYAIRRKDAWRIAHDLERAAGRSTEIATNEFPNDIRWIRSYVINEAGGSLGSICIYQASSPEAIRRHAERVGMPADDIFEIEDTVVVRADPAGESARS